MTVDLSAEWLAARMGYVAPMTVHEDWTADEVREHALLIAAVAVAALDAYDLDRETPEGGRKAAAVARAVLAERERIALDLDHLWNVKADEFGRRHDSYQEGYLDGIEHAAGIAGGRS